MECKDIEEHMIDFIDEILSEKETAQINAHLDTCDSCTAIHDETIKLLRVFQEEKQVQPSSYLKASFYDMLEEEKRLQTEAIIFKPQTRFTWKHAFQFAASIVLLLSGYFFGTYFEKQQTLKEMAVLQYETQQIKENMLLAMIDNRSPSKRIKAVNFTEEFDKPDTKVLEALIERLHYDANSNVRLATVEALAKFSDFELVKVALIEALSNDKNPSIQIEIINILVIIQEKRALVPMRKLLEQPETPIYVKEQATLGISQLI